MNTHILSPSSIVQGIPRRGYGIRLLACVSLAIGVLAGCQPQAHTVRYTLSPEDMRSPDIAPCHALRVAVAQVPREKKPYDLTPMTRLNCTALSDLLVQHLTARRVFAVQETAGPGAWKDTPREIGQLKARGTDALLLARVVTMQGGRAQSNTEQLGQALGSPLLTMVGAAEKTLYLVSANVEFKLISTLDGNTLWYGHGIGSAYGKEGLGQAIDASLKAAFANVINDLSAAQLDKRRLNRPDSSQ